MEVPKSLMRKKVKRKSKYWQNEVSAHYHSQATCQLVQTSYIKVIPLKLFYYQTFFETWRNKHS